MLFRSKNVVAAFHAQLEASKTPGTRVRYGFVPYSTNVNVGGLLDDDWVVDNWRYQSRTIGSGGSGSGTFSYFGAASPISGSKTNSTDSTYGASLSGGVYSCPTRPGNTLSTSTVRTSISTAVLVVPIPGTRTTETFHRTRNGNTFGVSLSGSTCTVIKTAYANYVDEYQKKIGRAHV